MQSSVLGGQDTTGTLLYGPALVSKHGFSTTPS